MYITVHTILSSQTPDYVQYISFTISNFISIAAPLSFGNGSVAGLQLYALYALYMLKYQQLVS